MDRTTEAWLEALDRRHLADFTMSEVARALRALSSCYVERRSKLAAGAALSSAGKRSAFALFYGPLHFLVTREIVLALAGAFPGSITDVIDLGCGTGAAGAGLAVASRACSIRGFDRHPWAVSEASWTYRQFGLRHARRSGETLRRMGFKGYAAPKPGLAPRILAAYAVNELAPEAAPRCSRRCVRLVRREPAFWSSNRLRGGCRRGGETGRPRSSGPAAAPTSGASRQICRRPSARSRAQPDWIPASSPRARSSSSALHLPVEWFVSAGAANALVLRFFIFAASIAILQNVVGAAVALALGQEPLLGVLAGSVTLTGGPATGLAFAPLFEQAGVTGAATVAVAAAMAGIVCGGLVGAPLATVLLERGNVAVPGAVRNIARRVSIRLRALSKQHVAEAAGR